MEENRIHRVRANVPDLSYLLDGMRHLRDTQIENLKQRINILVYDFYATIPAMTSYRIGYDYFKDSQSSNYPLKFSRRTMTEC